MNPFVFDIWLHVGREGRCFSYQDGNNLDIDLGDVVSVHLKGRLMQGLIVSKRRRGGNNSKEDFKNISLLKEFICGFKLLKSSLPYI